MANLEQIQARVESLSRRHKTCSTQQARLQGGLEGKRQELLQLKQEIEAAGYDPKTLREDRARLEAELEDLMTKFENELTAVEKAQAEYEK